MIKMLNNELHDYSNKLHNTRWHTMTHDDTRWHTMTYDDRAGFELGILHCTAWSI